MSLSITKDGEFGVNPQTMKRSKSESNIEVSSLIDKDQSIWNLQSTSTIGKNFNPANVINWIKTSTPQSTIPLTTKMDHSTNQTNLLKLQLQQVSNQIV